MLVEGADFNNLPEGCIANILSFTTPRDVCKLSLVSSTFRSAADSDAVWDKFLPSDINTLISQSSSSSSLSVQSKKHLYISLCQNPLLIDDGKKSLQLDKVYGKKCYMLSARILFIVWGDTPRYWRWVSVPESRFPEVAELVSVCWLEMQGWINTRMLSPNTLYGAYLVFKPRDCGIYGFDQQSVEVSICIAGGDTRRRTVFLDAERGRMIRYQIIPYRAGVVNRPAAAPTMANNNDVYPKQRGDGWLEVEVGDFFNEGEEDKEVQMGVYETKGGDWKGGLLVQGIEIRPKQCS
ncbi:hypothetical protein RJT34_23295 [Clitoria ternatea]|uniref:F-box domain-containing protein n=1 Tax=Clitoria ternatea TaxID=43366 RepID=A0AAN9FMA3_CLITE